MKQINVETRSGRRIAKKKYTKRFLSLIAIFAILISAFAYSKNSSADNKRDMENVSVELSTEKIDRDTVKIQLDNFAPLIKSLQISVGIEGNAKFKEDSIKWLVTSDSDDVKTHVKMGDNNKSMEIFIVSNEPLNKVGGKLEICEVDVAKDATGSSTYRIDSKKIGDTSYSYVLNDTNKQVTGEDMANLNKDSLTINSLPVISLKSLPSIVEGNIVIYKGNTFDAKSYIEVNDEEDGVISVDKVTVKGKVDTKKVGTYSITYSVTDSEGDTVTLDQIVIVEEVIEENVSKPVITINKNNENGDGLAFVAGEKVNLLDYITAVDYLGRPIEVKINGDYDLNQAGTYIVTVVAEDSLGNRTEEKVTIVVKEAPTNPEPPVEPENPEPPVEPENPEPPVEPENPEPPVEPENPEPPVEPENPEPPVEPENPEPPVEPENPEPPVEPENPETPENPGDSDNNGDNSNEGNGTEKPEKPGDSNNGGETETPEVPVNPEKPGDSTITDNKENNENKIPQTGQGIFYGVIIAIAAIGIGSGIYLLRKKK